MQRGRIPRAALGRHRAGPARGKHPIPRRGPFGVNRRLTVADGLRGVLASLCRRRREPLLVALDGVEMRSFPTLQAAAIFGGRTLPLLGAATRRGNSPRAPTTLRKGGGDGCAT
jgi:hypothetical protein